MENLITELIIAVVLGVLGLGGGLNMKLKKAIGYGLLELVKPSFKLPAQQSVYVPTFDDHMSNIGKYTLVEEKVFNKMLKEYPPNIDNIELGSGKGKAATVVVYTLSNSDLAFKVRWPSGFFYYLVTDTV